jgi:hypothetical protein
MLSCAALSRSRLMLTFPCAALSRCSLMLMLCRTSLRSRSMLMLSGVPLGGHSLMLVFSRTALRRCSLMLMSRFGSLFGQVRRDGLDPQGLDPRHHDWRCGWRKGTGRVVTADHHHIIPC